MKRFLALIYIILSGTVLFAQDTADYYDPGYMRNDNFIYRKNIRTVILENRDSRLSSPIIRLRSDEKLRLSFDDLEGDYKVYNYSLIHCNADWQPSNLSSQEFIEGFTDNPINDYKYSFNTNIRYTHYKVDFPNNDFSIKVSGNYLLKVFEDNDPEKIVITRRFVVYEDRVEIRARIGTGVSSSGSRDHTQEVDFSIYHPNYDIYNPLGDLKVSVLQNDRWDNAKTSLKPVLIRHQELVYDHTQENAFEAGNEFRYFEFRSMKFRTEKVGRYEYINNEHHVYLNPEIRRGNIQHLTNPDLNGRFLIRNYDGSENETEAEYAWVHFNLSYPNPITNGNVYVLGGLTDWKYLPDFKMRYSYENEGYECKALLKQGYYNYHFAVLKDGSQYGDLTLLEGNHYETENDYIIIAYHRQPGTSHDRVIGLTKINSLLDR